MAAAREQRLEGRLTGVEDAERVPGVEESGGHEPAHPANAEETVMLACHDDLEMLMKFAATIRQPRAAAPYM
jgi:hypothetical protein